VERYLLAGRKVIASPFMMRLDRLESRSGMRRDWAICTSQTPEGFTRLKAAIRRSLLTEGIKNRCGNTAHVTLSYRAPFHFEACSVEPIEWTIDRFTLLRGGGKPYRYEVEEQWLLSAPIPEQPSPQATLF
jgi:2'-5' RNA ligase